MENGVVGGKLVLELREDEGFCGYAVRKIIRKRAPDRCERCGAKNRESNALIEEYSTLIRSEAILHCSNIYLYTLENSLSRVEDCTAKGFEEAKRGAYEFALKKARDISEMDGLTLDNLADNKVITGS